MPGRFAEIVKWSTPDLRAERDKSEALFKQLRREEGPRPFEAACASVEPTVRRALAMTGDLLALTGDVFRRDPDLFQILRNFCGPPISEEDLWTLVGGPKFRRVPEGYADDTAEVISLVIDPVRFPWVAEARTPSASELDSAILASTVLIASRAISTRRRGDAATRQEAAVASVLDVTGFNLDENRNKIDVLDSLPRGAYSRERKVAGAKCDVPVRLLDGRLLAIECKVSNGPKNGWKRVIREVGGKSDTWRQQFGTQVLTAVVLAGVFDLSCLVSAQDAHNVALFWEHDLAPLAAFLSEAT